jgi:hypothetical protein
MDQTNYVSGPVPGFKDEVGQTVIKYTGPIPFDMD